MRIHEILEGPHDPYTHKAIFFAGSPGAGKTYVARKLAGVFQGLKQVNMDNIFKFLMTKKNLSWKMPPGEEPEREKQRQRSKELVAKQQQRYTDGGLGLLVRILDHLPRRMPRVTHRQRQHQLPSPCLGQLALQHPLFDHVEFRFRHRPFQSKQQPVVVGRRIVDAVQIPDQRPEDLR